MNVAMVCIGLLGLLLFGLGFAVSGMRGRTQTLHSFNPDPTDPLYKMVRAHGNTAEYAPMLAVLIYVAAASSPATWLLWVMGIVTFARYLIVVGLLSSATLDAVNPLRFLGAFLTYVGGLALCVAVLLGA